MEIVFLLGSDGAASTIPMPVEQAREPILASIKEQIDRDNILAVIRIVQGMITLPEPANSTIEAVMLYIESRDGECYQLINEIVETDTELTLTDACRVDGSAMDHGISFFPSVD